MGDPTNFMYESQNMMNSPDPYLSTLDELMNFSSESYTVNRSQNSVPKQEPKKSYCHASSCSSSRLISFGNSNSSEPNFDQGTYLSDKFSEKKKIPNLPKLVERVGSTRRSGSNLFNEEHVVAERKRREKLGQRFIALSSAIPGLKKMDKVSVLEDAIKYVKYLEERVKTLEQETIQRTIESVVFGQRSSQYCSSISSDDHNSHVSSYDHNDEQYYSTIQLPEIEARVSDKDVLIRIHYEKKKKQSDQAMGLVNILGQIEKLNLTILNTSVLPLGLSTIDLTVVAQMDVDYCMEVKDLVENLKEALGNNSIP